MSFLSLFRTHFLIFITIVVDASKLFCWRVFFSAGFQILFLGASTFPLSPSLPFHFNCIIHSFVLPPNFFVLLTATFCPSHLQHKKSTFDRLPTVLHSCRNIWHFMVALCSNSCIQVSLNFQVFLLRGIRMLFTSFGDTVKSQTNLCCVMHSLVADCLSVFD